jgi:hypothetical protein
MNSWTDSSSVHYSAITSNVHYVFQRLHADAYVTHPMQSCAL